LGFFASIKAFSISTEADKQNTATWSIYILFSDIERRADIQSSFVSIITDAFSRKDSFARPALVIVGFGFSPIIVEFTGRFFCRF